MFGNSTDSAAPARLAAIPDVTDGPVDRTVTNDVADASWCLAGLLGPDAGWSVRLEPGRHIVGRGRAAHVRIDDRELHIHHAALDVDPRRGWRLVQLSGTHPMRVDDDPCDGRWHDHDATITCGSSRLTLTRRDTSSPGDDVHPAEIRDRRVLRSPRPNPQEPLPPPDAPTPPVVPPAHTSGLLPAFAALAGASALAVIMHQPIFVAFAAIGTLGALVSWGAQRIAETRRRRSAWRTHQAATADYHRLLRTRRNQLVAQHRAATVCLDGAVATLEHRRRDLWQRRDHHPDCAQMSFGRGRLFLDVVDLPDDLDPSRDVEPAAPVGHPGEAVGTTVDDQPVSVRVDATLRLAVQGPRDAALGVVRALVVQLAASVGPADRRLVVVTDDPRPWEWLRGLPHLLGTSPTCHPDDLADLVGAHAPRPTTVVITDLVDELASRTGSVRRVLADGTALIALVDGERSIPHVCTSALHLSGGARGHWTADLARPHFADAVHIAGATEAHARAWVSTLVGLRDPDDPLDALGDVPERVSFHELHATDGPLDAAVVSRSWDAAGIDAPARCALGRAADGIVDVDLGRDGPHALVAGTTGSGKSELLRSLILGLAVACPPDQLAFLLIDYKGGAAFDACARLPHVTGVITDLDDNLAERALRSLRAELRRRETLLREHDAVDIGALRARLGAPVIARLVVIVDEFAVLAGEHPEFLHSLVDVARRGRSLGVHLLLATQRPSGVLSDDIRANTNLRIALRVQDVGDALDVVGDPSAAQITRTQPGRAVLRLDASEHLTFQTAHCDDVADVVGAVRAAAFERGVHPAAPVWLAPLPERVTPPEVDVIGLVDDPDRQRVTPLRWRPADGPLLVAGCVGSGVTSTLATVMTHHAGGGGVHWYVIDALGSDTLQAFGDSPHVGAVVRLHERERLRRLIDHLDEVIAERLARGGRADDEPWVVLVVDGLAETRASLDDVDTVESLERLDAIVTGGRHAGVVAVAGVPRPGALSPALLGAFEHRWVLHLRDAYDLGTLGVGIMARALPGRLIVAASGLEAQVRAPGAHPSPTGDDDRSELPRGREPAPAPIRCLPTDIDAAELPPARHTGGTTQLPIGRSFVDLATATLRVPDGQHALVIGPARSGRSALLRLLATRWHTAHPHARMVGINVSVGIGISLGAGVGVGTAPPDPLSALHEALDAPGELLVVVDDADLVDDADSMLARLVAGRDRRCCIIASASPDRLRQQYGHWAAALRRSRLGMVAATSGELDGDLLGAHLPRRPPIAPRPGLWWIVDNGTVELCQVPRGSDVATNERDPGEGDDDHGEDAEHHTTRDTADLEIDRVDRGHRDRGAERKVLCHALGADHAEQPVDEALGDGRHEHHQ